MAGHDARAQVVPGGKVLGLLAQRLKNLVGLDFAVSGVVGELVKAHAPVLGVRGCAGEVALVKPKAGSPGKIFVERRGRSASEVEGMEAAVGAVFGVVDEIDKGNAQGPLVGLGARGELKGER